LSESQNQELSRRVLSALSKCNTVEFAELVDPLVEIHTQRGVRHGPDEALRWAGRKFDHLERRYEIEELHENGDTVVALARVQYVWRETGQLGAEWLLGIALSFRDDKLVRWQVYEDPVEALEELEPV
jgi:ketosteroid isomerase-like protein